ncbi:MAG TPA: MGMT family protein [Steroidobacteraceae bacterium]|nr:MGMT family protein [Steroidobacteraceae bacterium]
MAGARGNLGELWQPLARRQPARGRDNPALEAIWQVIATIPRGRVSTYGEVARAAGFPGHARQTAYALRVAPGKLHLPWQRVLGAGGRIVFPAGSADFREQARRLRSEGVRVVNGRVPRAVLMDPDDL